MILNRRKALELAAMILALAMTLTGCSSGGGQQAVIMLTPEPTQVATPTPQPVNQAGVGSSGQYLALGYVDQRGQLLSPLRTTSRDITGIDRLVFESLVDLDEQRRPVAQLCDRWEYTPESNSWTFTLRQGIVFHDGSPLTAWDVVASYDDIVLNAETSPYYDRVRYIDSVEVVNELTVRVVCSRYGYMALYAMTFPIVQRFSLETLYPKGTGPYWFVEYNQWGLIHLEVNTLWWKQPPAYTVIDCKRYADIGDALRAFSSDEIQMIATRSTTAALSRQLSDRTTMDYTTLTWECLVPDTHGSILSDTNVRRALMYAIDRSSLASTVYQGLVQESEVPVMPGSWLYETQSAVYNYSPERALQILYDAGWRDTNNDGVLDRVKDGLWEDLAFTLITYNDPATNNRTKAAELIANQLSVIGIRVTVVTTDRAGVLRSFNSDDDFGMALVGYNLSTIPDLNYLLDSRGSGNCSRYAGERLDDLLTQARLSQSETDLRQLMSDIQLEVVNELPVMGLFFRSGTLISRHNIGGMSGIREDYPYRGLEFVKPE